MFNVRKFLNNTVGTVDNYAKRIIHTTIDTIQPSTFVATSLEAYLLSQPEVSLLTYVVTGTATILQLRNLERIWYHWDTKKIMGSVLDSAVLTGLKTPVAGHQLKEIIIKEGKKLLNPLKEKQDLKYEKLSVKPIATLPEEGMSAKEITRFLKSLTVTTPETEGKLSGAAYTHFEEELYQLLINFYGEYNLKNSLHPTVWPETTYIDAMLSSIVKNLFHAPNNAYVLLTGGGTSSIIECVNAYVQYAINVLKIPNPEIIAPKSIHFAFDKAVQLTGVKIVYVDLDEKKEVDLAQMERCINENTILLVGSAPNFPYGAVDNAVKIGQLAKEYGLYFHLDDCLGGYLQAWLDREKYPEIPLADFRIEGLNSISTDGHKFGLTPKDDSNAIFLDDEILSVTPSFKSFDRFSAYATPDWLKGSRNAANAVISLIVKLYYGQKGFTEIAERIIDNKNKLVQALKEIEEIHLPVDPKFSVVYMQTPTLNHHLVVQKFEEKGWHLNSFVDGFHICITREHDYENFIKDFTTDLRDAIQYVKANPNQKVTGIASAYKYIETGLLPPVVQNLVGHLYNLIYKSLPGMQISQFWNVPRKESDHSENTIQLQMKKIS